MGLCLIEHKSQYGVVKLNLLECHNWPLSRTLNSPRTQVFADV